MYWHHLFSLALILLYRAWWEEQPETAAMTLLASLFACFFHQGVRVKWKTIDLSITPSDSLIPFLARPPHAIPSPSLFSVHFCPCAPNKFDRPSFNFQSLSPFCNALLARIMDFYAKNVCCL